jgi:hypothetical protein
MAAGWDESKAMTKGGDLVGVGRKNSPGLQSRELPGRIETAVALRNCIPNSDNVHRKTMEKTISGKIG